MRKLISGVFGILALLSVAALLLAPPASPEGKTPLLWASGANPFRLAQIARFNELHPELKLKLDSSNNRFEKIIVQTSSGVGPDLYDALSGSFVQSFVETGVAWDLTRQAGPLGIAADVDTWPGVHNEITYEGRQYGYPANVGTFLVVYNKNVFDRFGVPYPEGPLSWEDFFALLQRVSGTSANSRERVWATNAMDYSGRAPAPMLWKMIFYSLKGEYFSDDGARLLIDSENLRLAFQMHKEALFNHRVLASVADIGLMSGQGGWGGGATTQFAEGRFATVFQTKAAIATLRGFVEEQKRKRERWLAEPERQNREPRPEVLRIGVLPTPGFTGRPFSCVALSQTVIINPDGPHRDKALSFLKFLSSDTYARMMEVYGTPPNPRHVRFDYPVAHPELAEHQFTRCVVESMKHGYQPRKSPFLLDFDVERVLTQQMLRLEANPSLDVKTLLAEAQQQLENLLALNLRRDKELAALHRRLTVVSSPSTALQ